MVQWLGFHAVTAEGPGFNLWLESKDPTSHVVHQKKIYKIFFKNNFYWSIVDLQCVSAVQQGESITHVYIYPLFRFYSHIGHYRVLFRVPCAI